MRPNFNKGFILSGGIPSAIPGASWWTSSTSLMNIANEYPGSVLQVGHEILVNIHNGTGTDFTDGTVIYIDKYYGNHHFSVKRALADSLDTARVLAVVTNPVSDGANGKATVFGGLHGLNTLGSAVDAEVYLSDTVPGGWTTTKPAIPIRIGYMGEVHATEGSFLIKIDQKPPSIYASLYSAVNHTFPTTAPQVVPLEGEETVIGIGHSTTVNPEEMIFYSSGSYIVLDNFQINRIAGGASPETIGAWLQTSTDDGATWVNVPRTLIEQGALTAGKPDRITASITVRFNRYDRLRVMGSASSSDVILEYVAPTADKPAKASVMFSLTRIGD